MLHEYLPIALLTALAIVFALGLLGLSVIFGPRRRDEVKEEPYESGMPPLGGPRIRLHVKYYLMAIIFLAFDVEVTFLYPWAVVYKKSLEVAGKGIFFLVEMMFFFAILFAGYIYGWKKGAYDWD
ncbi:MAG: NADH-quinone oxidoreductase subunit A [bacterium]